MAQSSVSLNGDGLWISEVVSLLNDDDRRIELRPEALGRAAQSFKFLNDAQRTRVVYGINTGFGPMASHVIGQDALESLQHNLVRSHAVGMGDPIDNRYVLAAMLIRLNALAKGSSGVSPDLLTHFAKFINHRIIPIVPEHGGVGASGDLIQLAHIALALIGEGEVTYRGERRPTDDVLRELGIEPYRLKIKEGLALINGTSMMTGIGAVLCAEAERLIDLEIENGAWALELVNAYGDSIAPRLHELRPHAGQLHVADRLRSLLQSSSVLQDRAHLQNGNGHAHDVLQIASEVQDVYSFRCIPQIVGPAVDALALAKSVIETEMNSVTDNPIVDAENGEFLHGGNFHGDYIAWALDQLKMTLVKLAMLSERRINFFLNQRINRRFPPFLNLDTPGLTLGLQGLQFVATSTTAQCQTLANPQYVHSIPTNGDNQDVVSMGTDAALITAQVLANAYTVLAVETTVLAQATEFIQKRDLLSESSRRRYVETRETIEKVSQDRSLTEELRRLTSALKRCTTTEMPSHQSTRS